jgi:hypothetical protein
VADKVYMGLGQVLTISGRTIKDEAQVGPMRADEARAAIEEFLSKVSMGVCSGHIIVVAVLIHIVKAASMAPWVLNPLAILGGGCGCVDW